MRHFTKLVGASFLLIVLYGCSAGGSVVPASDPKVSLTPSYTAAALSDGKRTPDARRYSFSSLFRASNNPFHISVAKLISMGARIQPQTLMNNLWAQGYYNESENGAPLYSGTAGQSSYTAYCTYYSSKGCNAQGRTTHFPAGAYPQSGSDHHITSVDSVAAAEFDGWGGGGGSQSCVPRNGSVTCSWGGWYPFSGKGLENSGNSANHAGYAFGLFAITAQELLNKRIDHALGWNVACLDNPTVYPADTSIASDNTCSGGHGRSPSASYGQLVHLKWTSNQIASSAYSAPCKTVLTAMATYGAYTYDDGNSGIQVFAENPQTYGSANPWYNTIYPQLVASGDGTGSGAGFSWSSCLNRLNAGSFEIFDAPNLGY